MTPNEQYVANWIGEMQKKYGCTVHGHGKRWDWGQAMCIEQYGLDSSLWPDSPSAEDVELCKAWLDGDLPDWIDHTDDTGVWGQHTSPEDRRRRYEHVPH